MTSQDVTSQIESWEVGELISQTCLDVKKNEFFNFWLGEQLAYKINPIQKYKVFSEKTDVPHLPNQSMVALLSHEAVTLKIRSRSPKSNKLLILSD